MSEFTARELLEAVKENARLEARLAEAETQNKRMRYALKAIADEVYDPWTNGAQAQRIALSVLEGVTDSAPTVLEGWCSKCGARYTFPSPGNHPCPWSDCDGTITVSASACRAYRTTVQHPHLCADCGRPPIEHGLANSAPADRIPGEVLAGWPDPRVSAPLKPCHPRCETYPQCTCGGASPYATCTVPRDPV